jgi:hypothetical protein
VTAPLRACTSSTSRSAASNVSCMAPNRTRTYVRISSQRKGRECGPFRESCLDGVSRP